MQGQNGSPYIPQGMSPTLVTTVPNINLQWGGGSVLGGPSEDVIVRFTGSILSNTTQEISFLATADDGTKLYLDGTLITNDWVDKGGGGTTSAPVSFTAGVPKTIELMYYENGGGANVFLHWDQSGSMDIIPAEAFTSQAAPVVNTIGAPQNLTVVDGETSTVLTWEAPNSGNTQPERYAIGLNTAGQNGWGISTGNVGGPNSLNTTITIDHSLLENLMPSGTVWSFHIRSDNDTLALYSVNSNVVTLKIGKTAEEIAAEEAIRLATEALAAQAAADAADAAGAGLGGKAGGSAAVGGSAGDRVNPIGGDLIALASGGIVTSPTMALIGEAGPEAVIPLSRGGGFGGGITITVNNAGSVIAEADLVSSIRNALLQAQNNGQVITKSSVAI